MQRQLDLSSLSTLPLFEDLTPEQMTKLNSLLHHKTFPARTTLMSAEQPGEVVYIILAGTVKVHVEQADGSDVILAILGPGEIIGELSLIDSQSRSATAVTLEKSTLLWLDRITFQQYLHTIPALSFNLARILARRLRLANAHTQALATQDIFGRVARQIVGFAQEYGQPTPNGDLVIPLSLTQSDLASLVGASRVRVNQVLGFYKERRYLSVNQDHTITVHNLAALVQRCQ